MFIFGGWNLRLKIEEFASASISRFRRKRPVKTHSGHRPRRREYAADRAGDLFVADPSSCRLLEVNAAAPRQAIYHVLRAEALEFWAVLASTDLDVERRVQ